MASLRYEKARAERNRLLSDGITDAGWFDALEVDMALYGAHIAQARAMTASALIDQIDSRAEGAFPKAVITLDGEGEERFQSGLSFDDVQDFIRLRLAHARAQARRQPLLLLDEVAAHLDDVRRAAMIEELLDLGTQAFLTGTDASLFEAFAGRAQSFHVESGAVTEKA